MLRWQLEATFQEARTHLGMETQGQWSNLTISCTTPILLGIFSWTTLAAHAMQERHSIIGALLPGATSRRPPSWMPLAWRDAACGWRLRVFHCQPPTLMFGNSPSVCPTG